LRFGLVIYGDLDTPTGGYLYDRQLVDHLRTSGHEVHVFSQKKLPYLEGIRQNFSETMLEEICTASPDILLEDELNHISLFELNNRLRRRMRSPIVAIIHHLSSEASRETGEPVMYEHFERLFLRSVDGFLFNSHATRESVEKMIGHETKGVVAPPGKDHLPIVGKRSPLDPGRVRMLFVGNVLPHKGLDIVIEAMAPLEGLSLDVVGKALDPDYLSSIESLVRRRELTGRVVLHGYISRDSLQQMMNQADVLVVPSFMEGYGIVYAEALGYGVPVIATTAGGAGEVITDDCGILVDPGDVEQLRKVLASLREDPIKLKEMREKAKRRYEDLPRWCESMELANEFLLNFSNRDQIEER